MIRKKIETILSDVSNALPEDMSRFKQEFEQHLRASLNASLAKMELVTREEFDIQTASLQRSREQLELLEKKLAALEKAITTKG